MPRRPINYLLLASVAVGLQSGTCKATTVYVAKDIQYGKAGEQVLRLDAYIPYDGQHHRPAIVYLHGGAWIGGSKAEFAWMGRALGKLGYVGFAVNYRLASWGANHYPAQVDDAQRAVRWVRAHATQFDIDPDRVGVYGESAGGHLAAMLGVTDTRDNSDPGLAKYSSRANCVVDLFGPANFELIPANQESWTSRWVHFQVFGKLREQDPTVFREASPINHVDATAAPFLIVHGTQDRTVHFAQSQRLYEKLKEVGTDAVFLPLPGEDHGIVKKANWNRFWGVLTWFLDRHLKRAGNG